MKILHQVAYRKRPFQLTHRRIQRPGLLLLSLGKVVAPANTLSTLTKTANMAAPWIPQDHGKVNHMVVGLAQASKGKKQGGFSVKKTTYGVKGSKITVDSWRMLDHDYKKPNLPTYARGIFTTRNSSKQDEIAVRGYDKFFNVGEVPETKWDNILARTQGPYELTLKENGCIIFIAGLEDDTLLICSKHSTGERDGPNISHATAGEVRLDKQLAAIGKTRSDLARELRRRNITAVAELCDDSFEEHILAYGPDKAGLYLHGINLNLPEFVTYPSSHVQEFADQWGFIKTGLTIMEDVNQVKDFLEKVAESGAHDGRDVEGFVIRCKMSLDPRNQPFSDWFFKFKFEEPYLMYRQWRECTKALIGGRMPKIKKHKAITEHYLMYAKKRLAADKSLGQLYCQNHGIIALRDDFLNFKNIKGVDAANMELDEIIPMPEVTKDVIISPIATIGCGKTTIALALGQLYGWGHIQNDNISGKGRPPRFVNAILEQLQSRPVCFADRNNASKHERKQLITDVKAKHPAATQVCLNFRHDDEDLDNIRQITQQRVLDRGDNHQTIHAGTDKDKFLGVMESFVQRFEACNPDLLPDSGFDVVIDLDPTVNSRENLETAVVKLHQHFPNLLEIPSSETLDNAISYALEYKPDFKHNIPDRGNKGKTNGPKQQQSKREKKKELEYLCVELPTQTINSVLDKAFRNASPDISRFYNQLKQTRRVQPKFHVTLMHRASAKLQPQLWNMYLGDYKQLEDSGSADGKLGSCEVILERVVFDNRIMAIVVRLHDANDHWMCVNRVAHITVGTRDSHVKPVESNVMLVRWLGEGCTQENQIGEVILSDKVTIQGDVRPVLSR